MFINRTRELAALNNAKLSEKAGFFILYGRRRVGKTELIKQFIQNENGLYFLADRLPERENLRTLTRLTRNLFDDPFLAEFQDWYTFFAYLKSKITQKTILVIDEFPYLLETNKALSSVFQKGWDETLQKLPVFLILCGSSIGMMERETLAYGSPLYGRRTGQMLVKPLRFKDFSDFFPNLDFDRRLEIFATTGGVPAYIQIFDAHKTLKENFTDNILEPEAYLFNDAEFILKEETREPRQYFAILRAIALGKHKLSEIVNETNIEKTSLHKYLYYLQELRIIEKRFPITEKNIEKSRLGLYYLADNYFSIWFNMVFLYRSELVLGNKLPSLARFDQSFVHHAAAAYEQIGIEILRKFQDEFFPFTRIGKWWHKNHEIDIVALGEAEKDILFAEVKWSTKKVGIDIYHNLVEKSKLVSGKYPNKRYALLSRSGYTSAMLELAKKENVLLVQGEEKV